MKHERNKYASYSLMSTVVTAALTSIHHAYELGYYALILVILFVLIPVALMQRFKITGNKGLLWIYGLLNTWLIIGFGVVDGLYNHVVKPLSGQLHALANFHGGGAKAFENALKGNFFYEATGILTFVVGIRAAYYGYKFIQMSRFSDRPSESIEQ